ncbi:hypothetical protein [Cognatilysobacter bugurensis]|uniref:Uncharacterized protein n=1 Tax=Cognatilysobacter bugurensis TaxID=543356 RepID=A0A918SWK8_9GAMM|nr:hypothetical protein [Lysobacter bugurensis]GHA74967.1 hypothetical protein GCM10007067_10040 [Lysobacter bugurensis]
MSRFPVIEGGPSTEGSDTYADRFVAKPASVEELHSRLQLNLGHLCPVYAWFDERDRGTFDGLRQSHAAFGRLLDDLSAAHASYDALYGPSSEELRRSLPTMGDHLQRALDELDARPSAEAASRVAIELEGAQRAALRFRERLLAEERGDGR